MKVFFDSSAFAKRFVNENGSDAVEELCARAEAIGLSIICMPEIISALNRRLREHTLTLPLYRQAKQRLLDDISDADIIQLTLSVLVSSFRILEGTQVRAMDALHIACAVDWQADIFVSADTRQLAAARWAGLRTKPV